MAASCFVYVAAFTLCCNDVSARMGTGHPADHPPCRKASIMRTLHVPAVDGGPGVDELILTAGKGFVWERAQRASGRGYRRAKKKVHFFNDTWVFRTDTNTWEAVALPGGGEMESFSGRWKAEADSVRLGGDLSELAVFGGCTTETSMGVQNDLWVFTPTPENPAQGTWRLVPTENPPVARRGHIVVANSSHLIIYGGKRHFIERPGITPNNCITDLWSIPLAALAVDSEVPARWTQGASLPAECRWGATGSTLTRPDGSEVFALFGGRNLNPNASWHSTAADAYTYFNELWLYDFQTNTWSKQSTRPANTPSKRDHHGADVMNGDLWVFAGRMMEAQEADADASDVWSFSLASGEWTRHAVMAGQSPSARFMPGVAGIRRNGEMQLAIWGGEALPGSTKRTTLNDLWVFSPSRGMWEMLSESHCHHTPVYFDSPQMHPDGAFEIAEQEKGHSPGTSTAAVAVAMSLLVAAVVSWRHSPARRGDDAANFHLMEA